MHGISASLLSRYAPGNPTPSADALLNRPIMPVFSLSRMMAEAK